MNDETLHRMLGAMAREKYVPPDRLVMRTKAAVRGRRLLQVILVCSVATQLAAVAIVAALLAAPGVPLAARLCGGASVFLYVGCVMVAAAAARHRLASFFRRVEQLVA